MEGELEKTDSHDDDNMGEENPISPAWRFNIFLDKISQDISPEELTRMKSFCVEGVLGKAALSKATTATKFFQLLRDMQFLSTENLTRLQAMLWHIGRKDLHERMVDFARKCRKTPFHFFSSTQPAVNGYTYVKFHVCGPPVDRQQMRHIRADVAELLCVESNEVLPVDYSQSNSSILTFMVPEAAVHVLQTLTAEDKEMFAALKVDIIMIGDVTIQIEERQVQVSTADPERNAFTKILLERDKLKSHLDRIQCRLIERTDDLRKAEENEKFMRRSKDQAMMTCLALLYNHRPATRIIDSLVSKSALVYFKHCLQQFQAKFPGEMDTIEILLDAKEIVACKTERDIWKQYEIKQNLVIALHVTELQMQQNMMMANSQRKQHIPRPPFPQWPMEKKAGTITLGVSVPTLGLSPSFSIADMAVIQTMEEISNILSINQMEVILRHLAIEDSQKKNFLQPSERFFGKLFNMKPRTETALNFVLETIRLLDDRNLEAKVVKKMQEFQEVCDKYEAVVSMAIPQVKFSSRPPKRPVEPGLLKRLQNDPDKIKECIALLQGLADAVEM